MKSGSDEEPISVFMISENKVHRNYVVKEYQIMLFRGLIVSLTAES